MVAALLLIATACGDDDETATEEPTTTEETTTTAETTTTTESPWSPKEQEVIDAHETSIEAYEEAAAPPEPDPEDPDIKQHFTDWELDEAVASLEILVHNGTARRYPPDEDPVAELEVQSVTFDEKDGMEVAYLDVCAISNIETVVLSTGKALPRTEGVTTTSVTRELHKVDGVWKVADREQHELEEGERECAFE